MPTIEVDGQLIQFPDDMSDQEISDALLQFRQPQIEQQQPQPIQQPAPDLYSGQTLRIGNIDTGVALSPEVFQFLAGAGARFADLPLAAQSLFGGDQAATTQQIEQKRALEAPLMETGAGQAGGLATDIALSLAGPSGGASALSRIAAAAGTGAALEATRPVTQYESLLGNAAVGGLTGGATQGILSAAGKAGKALANRFTEQSAGDLEKIINVAAREGVDLDLAQATGSRFYEQLKSRLSKLPYTAERQAEQTMKQQKQFNAAVLKRAGIKATEASEDVIDGAYKRLGKTFDNLVKDTDISLDQKALDRLRAIGDEARSTYGPDSDKAKVVENQINKIFSRLYPGKVAEEAMPTGTAIVPTIARAATDIMQRPAAGGLVPFEGAPGMAAQTIEGVAEQVGKPRIAAQDKMFGPSYRALRTDINNLSFKMKDPRTGNADLTPYLNEMVGILDDSVGKSLGKEAQQAWNKARSEWGTLTTLVFNDIIDNNMNISGAKLFNTVRRQNKKAFATGKAKLGDLARLGKHMQDKIPDPGTAGNIALDKLLSPGGALLAGGGTYLSGEDFDAAIKNAAIAGGASYLFQKGAQGLFNSKTLTDILLNKTKPQTTVIQTIKQIEKEVGNKIPTNVRQGLAKTIRNLQKPFPLLPAKAITATELQPQQQAQQ